MKSVPSVSAIIIFFNAEQYIEEAITSVFSQTHTNWELLLIDDGSTDTSTGIAKRFARNVPERVVYLEHDHHQNRGMSASRNLGLRHATGDYVAFLDADDVWLPSKLHEQIDVMERHPSAAMVYGRVLLWHSWDDSGNSPGRDRFPHLGVQPDRLFEPPALLANMLTNRFQKPCPSNALLRRDAFEKFGYPEDSFRGMYEDQVFYTKIMSQAPVYVSGAHWSQYRQHPRSCTIESRKESYYVVRRPLLEWVKAYLSNQGMRDERVLEVLKQQLWMSRHPGIMHWYHEVHSWASRARAACRQAFHPIASNRRA